MEMLGTLVLLISVLLGFSTGWFAKKWNEYGGMFGPKGETRNFKYGLITVVFGLWTAGTFATGLYFLIS